jgi:hypothetical protein
MKLVRCWHRETFSPCDKHVTRVAFRILYLKIGVVSQCMRDDRYQERYHDGPSAPA